MEESRKRMRTEEHPEHYRSLVRRGWIIVIGIAVIFTLYGLFAFFVIGNKGPPDWDFGQAEDTPGGSVEFTYPYRGRTEEPRSQHVDEKPPSAITGIPEIPADRTTPGGGPAQAPDSGSVRK